MVARSREQWRGLERDTSTSIYSEIGALWMITGDDSYVRQSAPILDELGFEVEPLGHDEAGERYPQIVFDGVEAIYLEHHAGLLAARDSCRRVVDQLEREGGATERAALAPLPGVEGPLSRIGLTDGSSIEGDHFVLACGPWLGSLLPDLLGEAITPTRQEVYYFGPPAGSRAWQPDRLPVWVDLGERVVYGFPDTSGRGVKFADDTRGDPVDPSSVQRRPTARLVDEARRYLARRFPALAEAPLVEARVCQYENSPDGHLILDRHPRVNNLWVAGGGSGHGFKLAPAVGEMMARAILDGELPDRRFSLARLEGDSPSRTQFESHGDSS